MTLTVDWGNKIVDSSGDILDLMAIRAEFRALEGSVVGIAYPTIITYKEIDLGGGATFPAIAFINGYRLRFPAAGNYAVRGNLKAVIIPVSGVYVERQTSAAYAVTSAGGGGTAIGPTAEEIAVAVWGSQASASNSGSSMGRLLNRALSLATYLGSR